VKTSGLFTTHSFTIPVKSGKPVRIIFFGDVHRDAPSHALEKWHADLDYWRSLKDVYFFGMGDYLDSTSTTERECLGNISGKMHETFRNDVQALQLAKVELIAKELSFMRGRIVGFLNGNHYFEFQSGVNSDQKLCELLGAKYLGVCSFVRLSFVSHGRHTTRDIFAHHGQGAARLIGGSLNRVAQMFEGVECDIVAMGHDHKRGAVPGTPRLFLTSDTHHGNRLCSRETWVIRSGSYLKSYEPGKANYNVDAQRTTCNLGHVEMQATHHVNKKMQASLEIKMVT
jgi:hypothetical protein